MKTYLPEGILFDTAENQQNISSFSRLREAFYDETVLEARAVRCDREHNLHIDLGDTHGFMPRAECALGIAEGTVRDIAVISRVNKPVCFKIIGFHDDETGNRTAVLSRRAVQADCRIQYLQKLQPGDVIDAVITRLEPFGAFCDVGAGLPALLPIDSISVSRIPHPSARFFVGQQIRAVLKSIDEAGRITLSHKELLGTWAENAARFSAGETVSGVVRSVEKYGIFVELAPNLAGLAEYVPGVAAGDTASVFIKSINPARLKIKLILVDRFPPAAVKYAFSYPEITHIDRWQYSPDVCEKQVATVFSE
ncbi:MAG: S1 RNA-binding domain-containing protein [Candidatus Fimenecus sp.]